jgi:hypothetical protein
VEKVFFALPTSLVCVTERGKGQKNEAAHLGTVSGEHPLCAVFVGMHSMSAVVSVLREFSRPCWTMGTAKMYGLMNGLRTCGIYT